MKIGELIVSAFQKLVDNNLLNPDKELFKNLMDIEYCTANLNLISRGVRYPLFLKGDAGEDDSNLARINGTRRYYASKSFNYTYAGDRYFLCSQLEEQHRNYFIKWFHENFGLELFSFANCGEVLFAKNIVNNKYFYIIENYPPSCNVNFTSCGLDGQAGKLTEKVLNYTTSNYKSPSELLKGFILDDSEYVFLPIAASYPESKSSIIKSKDTIIQKSNSQNNIWLPIMGLGNGKIPINEAVELYLDIVNDIFTNFGISIPTIVMDIPSESSFIDSIEKSELHKKLSILITKQFTNVISIASEFISDTPSVTDNFNRKKLAASFSDWVEKSQIYKHESAMILLTADWGEGKTTFANYFKEYADQKAWDTFFVNAWEYQRFMPNWWGVIYSIEKQILKNKKNKILFWINNLPSLINTNIISIFFFFLAVIGICLLAYYNKAEESKNLIEIIILIQLASWAVPLKYIKNLIEHRGEIENDKISTAKEHFEKLIHLQKRNEEKPIIVFIDDLDRCESEKLYCFLEGIRIFLQIKGVVFILCADEKYIVKSVDNYLKQKNNNGNDSVDLGGKFLQKLFQATIRLNKNINMKQFLDTLSYQQIKSKDTDKPVNHSDPELNKGNRSLNLAGSRKFMIDSSEISVEFTVKFVNSIIEDTLLYLGEDVLKQLTPRGLKRWHNYLSLIVLVINVEEIDLAKDRLLQKELAIISLMNSCFYASYFNNFLNADFKNNKSIEVFNGLIISKKSLEIYLGRTLS